MSFHQNLNLIILIFFKRMYSCHNRIKKALWKFRLTRTEVKCFLLTTSSVYLVKNQVFSEFSFLLIQSKSWEFQCWPS